MILLKYIACPGCLDVQEHIPGQEIPNCTLCSSVTRKMPYVVMNIHDTILLNVLKTLKDVKK